MSEAFEVVTERPEIRPNGRPRSTFNKALLGTLDNGGSVRFDTADVSTLQVRNRIAALCARKGLKAHIVKGPNGTAYAWVTRRDEAQDATTAAPAVEPSKP